MKARRYLDVARRPQLKYRRSSSTNTDSVTSIFFNQVLKMCHLMRGLKTYKNGSHFSFINSNRQVPPRASSLMNDATLHSTRAKMWLATLMQLLLHCVTRHVSFFTFLFLFFKGQKKPKVKHKRGSLDQRAPTRTAHTRLGLTKKAHNCPALYHITPLPNRTNHESSSGAIWTETKNGSEATQWLQWVSACNVICHSLCSPADMITGRASAGRVKWDGGPW